MDKRHTEELDQDPEHQLDSGHDDDQTDDAEEQIGDGFCQRIGQRFGGCDKSALQDIGNIPENFSDGASGSVIQPAADSIAHR